jgi:anti-anti-sigma factor
MKDDPARLGSSLTSKPTRWNPLRVFYRVGFFYWPRGCAGINRGRTDREPGNGFERYGFKLLLSEHERTPPMNAPTIYFPPKVEQSGNVRIITFTDGQVRDVENVLSRELEGQTEGVEAGHVLLDFTKVEYITSCELGTLIALHKRMKTAGGRLTLFNLNAQIYETFTVCCLQMFLNICRKGSGGEPSR